jgi:flagellar hook assembly protein FlgD
VSFAAAAALGNGAGRTELEIFDAAGRRVRTLVAGEYTPGFHTTTWDGLDAGGRTVSSGIYFLQLRTEGQSRQIKIVVAR